MNKRRTGFLIALSVATITFGSLWFGLGSENFNRGQKFCERDNCNIIEHHNHCCEKNKEIKAEKVIIIKEVLKTDTIQ